MATVLFFVFKYPFSFNYETYLNDQYDLIYALPFLAIVLTGLLFQKQITFSWLHIIGFVYLIVSLLLIGLSKYYSFGNEYFFDIVAILFISSGLYFFDKPIYFQILIFFLLGLFFYQIYQGFEQWSDASDDYENTSLSITGTLQNSGIYACYLAVHLPFLYWLFFNYLPQNIFHSKAKDGYKKIFYWFCWVVFIGIATTVCLLIWKTQSRTAYIAVFITIMAYFIIHYGNKIFNWLMAIPKKLFIPAILIGIAGMMSLAYYLFNLKKLSAFGRLARIDITWQHITDMFWFGTGLGRFTWYYPQWQAAYFATHPNPPKDFFISAGESYIIFNEYLQLFKEIGCIGFVLFIGFLICFFRTRSQQNNSLLNAAKLTVIAIFACGFTSYPFHVNIFLLILLFCFVIAIRLGENNFLVHKQFFIGNHLMLRAFSICLLVLVMFVGYKSYCSYAAVEKWHSLTDDYSDDTRGEIVYYKALYPFLKNDGKFLTEYGIALGSDSAQTKKAVAVLERAELFFISKETIDALAKAYEQEGNYAKAVEAFKWLADFLPNQFTPKYELLKVYQKMEDTAHIKQTALSILSMTVKVPSQEVEQMKAETQNLLNNLK